MHERVNKLQLQIDRIGTRQKASLSDLRSLKSSLQHMENELKGMAAQMTGVLGFGRRSAAKPFSSRCKGSYSPRSGAG